ncbi:MAG: hypothetical protein DWP92_07165 [Armatimonadetes bacterium]|nr:MAG: hypothetical protein DWP92_07165 [Armatimonadota bacterium]
MVDSPANRMISTTHQAVDDLSLVVIHDGLKACSHKRSITKESKCSLVSEISGSPEVVSCS